MRTLILKMILVFVVSQATIFFLAGSFGPALAASVDASLENAMTGSVEVFAARRFVRETIPLVMNISMFVAEAFLVVAFVRRSNGSFFHRKQV